MNRFHRWYCRSNRWASTVENRLLPWVLEGVPPGDEVLEVGPGPGSTTEQLRNWAPRMTAIEIDPRLADALRLRLKATNVEVVTADATRMPFEDARFSTTVSFTMLHHVPSAEQQDRLLGEVLRVLRPGGVFAGSDSTPSFLFKIAHLFDTMELVDPDTFTGRLERTGFVDVVVERAERAFRFRALRPRKDSV